MRDVWLRHSLVTRQERPLRLGKITAESGIELSHERVCVLEQFSPKFRERHVEALHTSDLVAVDTFFAGHLKGIGKGRLQGTIDGSLRHAWARLYSGKLPGTAVHLLNNQVLLTSPEHQARVATVLSDNGREYCSRQISIHANFSSISRRSSAAAPGGADPGRWRRTSTLASSAAIRSCRMGPRHEKPHTRRDFRFMPSRTRMSQGGRE